MKRRRLLNLFLGGSILGTAGSFLYPLIRYLIPPPQAEAAARRILAAKVGELAPNSAKLFKFGAAPALLIHTAEGELRAFTAICTHLTCTVHYEADTGTIFCPCHNGRFDLSGNVLSGPPPKPLEPFAVEVSAQDIYVSRKS
jgi:cytochrome b6-f complex iron-sulfur subunit